jgi:hypothetical protein
MSEQIIRDDLRGDAEIARLRLQAAHAEIERLRLTDAEREAIATCIADDEAATAHERADTLRGLLHRHAGPGDSHE